jgi:hypothetical protein
MWHAFLEGPFTVGVGGDTLKLKYRCARSQAADGMGQACSFGDNEVYASLVLLKVG